MFFHYFRASQVRERAHREDDPDGDQRPLANHRRRKLSDHQSHSQLQNDLRRVGRTGGLYLAQSKLPISINVTGTNIDWGECCCPWL